MLLIYTRQTTSRVDYIFKHICTRILGLEISFTSAVEQFVSHQGPKMSYGKQALGNEFFIKSQGLLFEQGFEDQPIQVRPFKETVCFFAVDGNSHLAFDIFSAAFYLMSRYEEYLPHVKDTRGRFPAEASLGFKEGFLMQPVVDIWAQYFGQALKQQFPAITLRNEGFKTHTIINAELPYRYLQRGAIATSMNLLGNLIRLRFVSFFQVLQVVMGWKKDPYDTFEFLMNNSGKESYPQTLFFLLGEASQFSRNINSRRKKFQSLVKYVADYTTVGLVISQNALSDLNELQQEKKALEELTHREVTASMNTNYLISLPDIYRLLVEVEIPRDFSMVYEDQIGFRAGTCTPFLFYDLDYEIKTPLLIQPVAAAISGLQGQKRQQVHDKLLKLMEEVRRLNGEFSVILRNEDFAKTFQNRTWHGLYDQIRKRDE
ncbi:hypothetical protein BST85_08685 [Aureitalea marina]|uniref:DUF7033 domain-containing protein n=2 Tax=Aureitalea marina TaxID=930804 RepID=A0A2S7KQP9_9FLAO|nr:hypothetical protein BST85_08685 [Aureitalea marina]